jgi:hypothetical protein
MKVKTNLRAARVMRQFRGGGAVARIRVQSLTHLANLYRVQGRYRRAEPPDLAGVRPLPARPSVGHPGFFRAA